MRCKVPYIHILNQTINPKKSSSQRKSTPAPNTILNLHSDPKKLVTDLTRRSILSSRNWTKINTKTNTKVHKVTTNVKILTRNSEEVTYLIDA